MLKDRLWGNKKAAKKGLAYICGLMLAISSLGLAAPAKAEAAENTQTV